MPRPGQCRRAARQKVFTQTGYEIWQELNGHRVTPIRPKLLSHQVVARCGEKEVRVDWRSSPALLPVWSNGLVVVAYNGVVRALRKSSPILHRFA
jgi:hypothetical protein